MSDEPNGGASDTTEPARGSSSGTDVSLRDYIDSQIQSSDKHVMQRFTLTDKALDAALAAAKEAVDKAEKAAEKRFDSVNEFRQTLSDQATTFVHREVFDAKITALEVTIRRNIDEIAKVRETQGTANGRADGVSSVVGYLIAVSTLIISVVIIVVNVLLK